MQININLTGSQREIDTLFDTYNIRYFNRLQGNANKAVYDVKIRVDEDFKFDVSNTTTIKQMSKSLFEHAKNQASNDIVDNHQEPSI